jgi:ABC-type branched-subunit amino acid transport system substrate-binding protein
MASFTHSSKQTNKQAHPTMKKIVLAFAALLFLQACSGTDYSGNPWERKGQTETAQAQPGSLDMKNQWTGTGTPPIVADSGTIIEPAPGLTIDNSPVVAPIPSAVAPLAPGQKVKVALLVPLSGSNAEVGEAISNAAQMALFDTNANGFELIPRDTHGTASGAAAAAQSAVQDGAQLILGPLFADEVRAVSPIVQSAGINMVAFTTDWKQAGPNTFVMGFLPFGQVQRVISYAASKGIRSIGVIAPQSEYGNAVMNAYGPQAQASGITTVDTIRARPGDRNLTPVIQQFAKYDARKLANGTFAPAPFDAVFLPVTGADAQTIANLLTYYELDASKVRRLGTGLWDDPGIVRETNLNGGWFAAPDPAARKVFEQKYRDIYSKAPPRLASLGYDATALAAVLAKTGQMRQGSPSFDRAAMTNANGFSGIDGIFRFRPDGLAERGMAILEIRGGQAVVIDPAPRTFQAQTQ